MCDQEDYSGDKLDVDKYKTVASRHAMKKLELEVNIEDSISERRQVSEEDIKATALYIIEVLLGTPSFREKACSSLPSDLNKCQFPIAEMFYKVLYESKKTREKFDAKKATKAHMHAACVRSLVSGNVYVVLWLY